MIPKVTVGASVRGALEYDFSSKGGEPRAEYIGGTLIGTPRQMAAQAAALRQLRPDCKKPIFRVSLSLPPNDGQLSAGQWLSVIDSFRREMNIPDDTAWCAVRHTDRDHDHIHFTMLRILPDGQLWNQENSAKRAIRACQVIEKEFHLSTHSREKVSKSRPTRAETEIHKRTGNIMSREHIQDIVDAIFAAYPGEVDFKDFKNDLAAAGIVVEEYAPKGQFKGVSYTDKNGIRWPGSKIGRDYSAGLIERGLVYKSEDQTPAADTRPINGGVEQPATAGIALAQPGEVMQNVVDWMPGSASPLFAAVLALNQMLMHLTVQGARKIAESIAKFVRAFLRYLGFEVADPKPSESQSSYRVEMPTSYQSRSRYPIMSPSAEAKKAADFAAGSIDNIAKLIKYNNMDAIAGYISNLARNNLKQSSLADEVVDSIDHHESRQEMQDQMMKRIAAADWLYPRRKAELLISVSEQEDEQLIKFLHAFEKSEIESQRSGFWLARLKEAHQAYRVTDTIQSSDQARKDGLFCLKMYLRRLDARISQIKDPDNELPPNYLQELAIDCQMIEQQYTQLFEAAPDAESDDRSAYAFAFRTENTVFAFEREARRGIDRAATAREAEPIPTPTPTPTRND